MVSANVFCQTFIRYGLKDGLESHEISHLEQDELDNLWIATFGGGLSSFNGTEFTNYTVRKGVAHNYVIDVFSSDHTIYALTHAGISKFEGGFFKPFSDGRSTGIKTPSGIYFRDDDFNLNLIKNGKIYSLKNEELGEVISVSSGVDDRIFVLTRSEKLYELKNGAFRSLHDFAIAPVFDDKGEVFWIGDGPNYTRNILLHVESSKLPAAFKKENIRQVLIQSDNRTWIIYKRKLHLLANGELKSFSFENGFTDKDVNQVFEDREGTIWIASFDGLYQYVDDKIKFVPDEGKSIDYATFERTDDGIITGTTNGELYRVTPTSVIPFPLPISKAFKINGYMTIKYDSVSKVLWLGTLNQGLFQYKDGILLDSFSSQNGFPAKVIRHILPMPDGVVWVGTDNGVYKIQKDGTYSTYTISNGLSDNVIWGLLDESGGVISVLTRKGLDYINREGVVTHNTFVKEVFNSRIMNYLKDDYGNYWFGTLGYGVKISYPGTTKISEITSDQGLSSDVIMNLMNNGNTILVGTNRGVNKINLDSIGCVTNIEPISSNYLSTQFNSFYKDKVTKTLWFGGTSSVGRYNYAEKKCDFHPIVFIDRSTVSGGKGEHVIESSRMDSSFVFDHFQNNIVFNYSSTQLSSQKTMLYSYRLVGLGDEWTRPSKSKSANFTHLSPGPYTFEVHSYSTSGLRSELPATFSFVIQKPFWAKWWFIAGISLTSLFLITAIYKYRVREKLRMALKTEKRKQDEIARVRKEISRDFHDNIGNKLAGIKLYSNLVSTKLRDSNQEVADLLKHVEKNAHSLFEGTKDFIWSIDPESDNLLEVYTYVKDFGEEFFKNMSIAFYSDLRNSAFDNTNIPSGWSRQIVLIFKEAMTNTVKHADATIVRFELEIGKNDFKFKYADNGKGMVTTISPGKGLQNMKARAARIEAELFFVNEPNSGVEISLTGRLGGANKNI
jgi:signal transduction histidine kinase/ligand-binding sensor domain-containing protein